MAAASPGISPEQLAQLKALLQAVAPKSPDWMDGLKAVGEFIGHAGWPIVALIGLILFRGPIGRIRKVGWKDFSVEVGRELDAAEKRASAETPEARKGPPTAADVAQSGQVARLAQGVDIQAVRATAVELAAEYERVRASMPSGDARTRRMEVVVSKMRALGEAVIPLRHEFRVSPTPGQRLVAIASMQVSPDYEALDWLVQCVKSEKPFMGYHAALALLVAARDPRASAYLPELRAARRGIEAIEAGLPADSDRTSILAQFKVLAPET